MQFKTSDGVNLYYQLDGVGSPLLMLSGIWSDTTTWNAQVRGFDKYYTCIRFDHRGIGQSEKWAGEHSYELHAQDVKELLDHLGLNRVAILGVCHGGMAAVTLALNYPGYASALCINATQLLRSERMSQTYIGWKLILETSGFDTLYRVIMPTIMSESWLTHNRARLPALLETIKDRIDYPSALKMVDACVDYSTTGFKPEKIAAVDIPALIMAGSEDMFIPPRVIQAEGQYWPKAAYHLFEQAGHFPQREIPDTYNAVVLNYLQTLSSPNQEQSGV